MTSNDTPQFGTPLHTFTDRPGAYGVLCDPLGKLLVVSVRDRYHLPGGGIDAGENPETALRREILEETGLVVDHLDFLGKANQFLETKDLGPINKNGTYFCGNVDDFAAARTTEPDHEVQWIDPDVFLSSNAHDFHKWAVQQFLAGKATTEITKKP